MTMQPPTLLLDPDDLERMPDGDQYELIDGVLQEKHMGAESDHLSLKLGSIILAFVERHRLGHVFGSQTGYRCFPHRKRQVRKPDVSFVANGRLTDQKIPKGDILIAPDIAVEVVSPNDLYEEIEEKIDDYIQSGVKLIWIVSPTWKTVQIRRLDLTAAIVTATGTLSGEDVIPGFTCPLADLFV